MSAAVETSVLIVGAGPVGMTLALDLAWRGIDCTLVEQRAAGAPPSVKCNHVSARSMEVYRRLGLAQAIRDAGLPADYPNDCAYRTTATGIELARIPIPPRAERYRATGGPDTWWPTPEPPHRINQIFLEPVLFEHAQANGRIRILSGTALEDFVDQGAEVAATLRNLETGERIVVRCAYIVGCDGGRSTVRRQIGAKLEGTPVIQRVQSTYLRAPELLSLLPGRPAWMYLALNPRRCGTVVAIDGRETWLVHNHLYEDEPEFDSVDRDRAIRSILGVGSSFSYDVISEEDWVGRRLVADRFRQGRAFICGDAAHLWIPYAGYGMNAGIADAIDLSWMLAATLDGWGSPAMLDAYEAERRPITEQVSQFAMNIAFKIMRHRRSVPAEIEDPGPEGDRVRERIGREAYDLNVQQYCCGGLNFGYFYDRSPIIAYDGADHPPYTMYDFSPSSTPGCRAPHIWLSEGRSLYDVLGKGYTLLRFDQSRPVQPLVSAAAAAGVPLELVAIADDDARAAYGRSLALIRPDFHVAWRGHSAPGDCAGLIEVLRGARVGVVQEAAA